MKRFFFSLLLLVPIIACAQRTRHHGVFWGRVILADSINSRLKWELYLQKRTQNIPGEKDIFGSPHFYSAWIWINYQLTKNLKLSVSPFGYFDSYAFLSNPADADLPGIKEFRWTVRLEQEQKLKWLNYSNRYGIEYRRRDLANNDIYQPNWRARYQLRLEKPVKGILPNGKPISFHAGDEIFLQFGKAVINNPNTFDQNRLFAGFSFEIIRNVKTNISYLNILQERNSGKEYDDAHAIWIVITFDNLFSQLKRR